MTKKFDPKEYNKNYYQLVTKQKRQERKQKKEVSQPTLFDIDADFDTDKPRRKITLQRSSFDTDFDTPEHCANTSNNVRQVESVKVFDSCQSQTLTPTLTLDSMVDDLATQLQSMAFSRLFPASKKTINPWALSELFALVLLSLIVLFFTAQAVSIVDQSLMPLVALLEFVAMFFSLTLAKHSGFKFLTRVLMILSIVGLTNFLVARATWAKGEGELIAQERAEASRVVILSEIERERQTIGDLQTRGRITQAGERTKRLDSLITKSELLSVGANSVADRGMVWVQVALRLLLGLALILVNGQISEIIVGKKFLKFA